MKYQKNNRLLAVDDDPLAIGLYKKLFSADLPPDCPIDPEQEALLEAYDGSADLEQRERYSIDCFNSGLDAVSAVVQSHRERHPYAVALIDMRMDPGIDGLETAQRIRVVDPDLHIIFITAFDDHGIDQLSYAVGGQVLWFRKPFKGEELYQTVRNAFWAWNQASELRELKESLDRRIELQAGRISEQAQTTSILQQNSLVREQYMLDLRKENRMLKGYHELRRLLSRDPLPSYPPQAEVEQIPLLLVEPDQAVVEQLTPILQATGFDLSLASSDEEAFKMATAAPPEVVLIDSVLAQESEMELVSLLQDDHRTIGLFPFLLNAVPDVRCTAEVVFALDKRGERELFAKQVALIHHYLSQQHVREERHYQQITEEYAAVEQTGNNRILIVDDDEPNLESLTILLGRDSTKFENQIFDLFDLGEQLGTNGLSTPNHFEVSTAKQGIQAIDLVLQAQQVNRPFALALIDINMPPGIDGLTTAREIRKISPEIDIVILTAYADYSLEEMQNVLGMDFSFKSKPYKSDEILQRVIEGCDKWSNNAKASAAHSALLNLAEDMDDEIVRRREAEVRLAEANSSKDDFIASMSHGLRTPLTTMIGYNELLLDAADLQAGHKDMVKNSQLAGKSLLQLVNDVIDTAMIRSGNFELSMEPFDLQRMLLDLYQLMEPYGQRCDVALQLRIDEAVVQHLRQQWIGDEVRITQVLYNLLSNAIKFSEHQGEVTLRLQLAPMRGVVPPEMELFSITIEDQGIGMSRAQLEQLFHPLIEPGSTSAGVLGGTGLGLYISYQLMQQMGGRIDVASTEGEGTAFMLMLPLKRSEQQVPVRHGEREDAVPALQGKVLIAEDTPQLQGLIQILVEQCGATVEIVSDGVRALQRGSEAHYSLILMDMQMPNMDGIEATRQLRQRGVQTPIVALTAYVMTEHREIFRRAGGDGFLSKPIKRSELYAVLAQYLERTPLSEGDVPVLPEMP